MSGPARRLQPAWLAVLTLLPLPAGCAPRPVIDPAATLQPCGPVTAEQLFALERRSAVYRLSEGVGNNRRLTYELAADGAPGWWRQMFGDRSAALLERDDRGGLSLVAEDDLREAVHVEYDPPLAWLPHEMHMNRPAVGTSDMTVRRLSDGKLRDRGTCRYQIELLGKQTVKTDAGSFPCHIVRTIRQIDLRLATVRVDIWAAYTPGHGLVAERVRRDLKALGLFESGTERLLMLAQLPSQPVSPE